MNYLVHLYLAGPDPEHQLGGLMGDFVKGPIPSHYPKELARGLYLHRRIDSFAQSNRHTRQSRHRLHPRFGHGRGIIVDIFYDHFLASCWPEFSVQTLESYADTIYRQLRENHPLLPAGLQQIAPLMIEHNWLVSYQKRVVVGRALHRIAQRLSKPLPLAESVAALDNHEASFRDDFRGFMAEAKDFVSRELEFTN